MVGADDERPLTVRVLQRIVPRYRLPVFEALAATPGISLEIWASFGTELASVESITGSTRFKAVEAPTRLLGPFHWQPRAMQAAMEGDCDVLIASWTSRDIGLRRVLSAARRAGRATLLWGHGFGKTVPLFGDWLRDRVLSLADGAIFYGPSARDRFVARGFPADRLFVAPNAVDQTPVRLARESWLDDPARLAGFLRERGLEGDQIVLFLSRLEPDKRPDLIVRAAPLVLKKVPRAKFVFIGKGSQRQALERLASDLGIAESMIFTGAIFDEAELAPWCLSARLLVHPGGIGLTIFHAFGFGLPVLTTDHQIRHGPEFEMLEPGRNGLLFRDGDEQSLAESILRVLQDGDLRRTLASEALKTVDVDGGRDVSSMVAGFLSAIRAVAPRRRPGSADPIPPTSR